jgi:pimeloyl-ACP methyl ester carboxylesterase
MFNMRKITLLIAGIFILSSLQAQNLVSITPIDTSSAAFLNFFAMGRAQYDVVTYKVVYNTVEADGTTPTTASGALCLPLTSCDSVGLLNYSHGTVLRRNDVPSRNNLESTIGKVSASAGYAVTMPDYLGLGDNPGIHPYLHANSQATSAIDLMRAAREFITDSISAISLSGQVLLTGYSQGGHAAMGTAKYIQDNNLFSEFDLTAIAPASGPYNLAGSQSTVFVDDLPYSNPGYVVYLLLGMNRAYGNIFNDVSEILKSPYDTLIPPFFNGNFDMDTVNSLLPARISLYLEDTVLQNFVSDTVGQTHPIWQALNLNSNHDWTPQFPVRMYYCTADEQVSFQNALDAEAAMLANGVSDVKAINRGALNHGGCVSPSVAAIADYFDSVSVSCTSGIGLVEKLLANETIKVFPNPADQYLQLEGLSQQSIVFSIYDLRGQLQMKASLREGERLSIAHLPLGIYIYRAELAGRVLQAGRIMVDR